MMSLFLHSLFLRSVFLILLCCLSLTVRAENGAENGADDDGIRYSFDHFSYAGPMAVMQLANEWHGDMKSGDDAISFIQNEISIRKSNFQLGYLTRSYHQFHIDNELARGFYYYNNDISLDEEYRIKADLKAKTYAGQGIRLGYDFSDVFSDVFSDSFFSITPSLVALRLDDIIWGDFQGELFYNDTKNWGGTIDLDYAYTEDHIVRRPLQGDYLGWLYGLDLEATVDTPWLVLDYQGINVYSRIYWDGVPRTTAQVSTETAFLLFGYEYYEDLELNPPALHYLAATVPLAGFSGFSSARITPIKSFYYHGLQFNHELTVFGETKPFALGLQYDFASSTPRLSMSHPNLSFELASQTLDVSRSQQLEANFTFHYTF